MASKGDFWQRIRKVRSERGSHPSSVAFIPGVARLHLNLRVTVRALGSGDLVPRRVTIAR